MVTFYSSFSEGFCLFLRKWTHSLLARYVYLCFLFVNVINHYVSTACIYRQCVVTLHCHLSEQSDGGFDDEDEGRFKETSPSAA